jgi:hypothetical protein
VIVDEAYLSRFIEVFFIGPDQPSAQIQTPSHQSHTLRDSPVDSSNHESESRSRVSQTLPEVFDFAHWAFGPDGLPELEILAYGDFSYQGRQPNILLCRSQDLTETMTDRSEGTGAAHASNSPYRQVTRKDVRLWEMVQGHSDLLEACAEDYLLH